MPPSERNALELIDEYLGKKVRRGRLSQGKADAYRARLMIALDSLRDAGLGCTPSTIGEPEIEHILDVTFGHERPRSKRWDVSILNGYLKHYGNKVIDEMMITWPQDGRVNVDWLSSQEAVAMLEAARPGIEQLVVHLELRLWLRRIEVQRMTPEDIQEMRMLDPETEEEFDGFIHIHGKGRAGGKWRTLPYAPETKDILREYDRQRERMIAKAREIDPQAQLPRDENGREVYVIYRRRGRLGAYSKSGIDSIVARVAKRAGIARTITNHTLRRTGARIAYFAGVLLVEIMEGLGHSSEKETIKYLGLTVNELSRAQAKVHQYLQRVKARMKDGAPPVAPSEGARVSG